MMGTGWTEDGAMDSACGRGRLLWGEGKSFYYGRFPNEKLLMFIIIIIIFIIIIIIIRLRNPDITTEDAQDRDRWTIISGKRNWL
jgi:hypothetical protein